MGPFGGDASASGYGAGLRLRNLAAALAALAALAGARGGRGAHPRLRRLADRGLRPARGAGLRAAAPGLARGARRGRRRRSSTAASPATPRPAGWRGSAGRSSDDIDAVIVELGANDMLRGIDPGVMRRNLDGILTEIGDRGLPAIARRAAGAAELSARTTAGLQGDVPRPRRGARGDLLSLVLRRHGPGPQHARDHAADAARRPAPERRGRAGDRRRTSARWCSSSWREARDRRDPRLRRDRAARAGALRPDAGAAGPAGAAAGAAREPAPDPGLPRRAARAAARGRGRGLPRGARRRASSWRLPGVGLFGGAEAAGGLRRRRREPGAAPPAGEGRDRGARRRRRRCPARRFVPHVTLARLPERFADRARLERAVAAGAAPTRRRGSRWRTSASTARGSRRRGAGYEELARYPLG